MLPLDPEGTCTGPLRSPYLYISSAKANTHDTFSLLEDDSSQPTAATSLTSIINSRRRSPSTSSRGEMSISYLLLTAANQPASLASSSSCSAFHSPPPPLSPSLLYPLSQFSSPPASPPLHCPFVVLATTGSLFRPPRTSSSSAAGDSKTRAAWEPTLSRP